MHISVTHTLEVRIRWSFEASRLLLHCETSQSLPLLQETCSLAPPGGTHFKVSQQDDILEYLNGYPRAHALGLTCADGGFCLLLLFEHGFHICPEKEGGVPWITTGIWFTEGRKPQRLRSFPIRFPKTSEAAAFTLDLDYNLARHFKKDERIQARDYFSRSSDSSLQVADTGLRLAHCKPQAFEDDDPCRSLSYLTESEWLSLLAGLEDRPYAGFQSLMPMRGRGPRRKGQASTREHLPNLYRGSSLQTRLIVPTLYLLHEIAVPQCLFAEIVQADGVVQGSAPQSRRSLWLLDSLRLNESAKLFRSRQNALFYALGYRDNGVLMCKSRCKNWYLGFADELHQFVES